MASPAEDLAVEDSVPGVGVGRPAAPSFGDLAQLLLCSEAFGEHMARDRGIGHAIGPQPTPPCAVVGRRETPYGGARYHVVEACGVRPRKEESARVGLARVAARNFSVQRQPAVDRGLLGVPAECAI